MLEGLGRSVRRAAAGDWQQLVLPACALVVAFLCFGFFGHAKGETARLWLPLMPIACGVAGVALCLRPKNRRNAVLAVVLILQWLTIWFIKSNQDFW